MEQDLAAVESIKRRLLDNWEEEIQASGIYSRLAEREPDPNRKRILMELSQTEDRHAEKWAERLAELGETVPGRETIKLPRSVDLSLRFAPVDAVIAHQEVEERRMTGAHTEMTGDAATDALLTEISSEDAEHARTLRALLQGGIAGLPPRRDIQAALDAILHRETWHRSGGGWIGGAIYGVNDGLAAVFGIVAGTSAAYQGTGNFVLIAGLAGALASSVSMGSGAFLASRAEGELYETQLDRERREIEDDPDEERRELELFYQLKGLTEAEAKLLADRISQNPEAMLDAQASEELKLGPNPGGKPIQAGIAAAISTAVGAIIPVIPFFFVSGRTAIIIAAVVSIAAHFAVGAAKALVTLRKWWSSGLEMTAAGILVGGVTYAVGLLFHVS